MQRTASLINERAVRPVTRDACQVMAPSAFVVQAVQDTRLFEAAFRAGPECERCFTTRDEQAPVVRREG